MFSVRLKWKSSSKASFITFLECIFLIHFRKEESFAPQGVGVQCQQVAVSARASPVDGIREASRSLLQPAINISLQESSTYILSLPTPPVLSAGRTSSSAQEENLRETEKCWREGGEGDRKTLRSSC